MCRGRRFDGSNQDCSNGALPRDEVAKRGVNSRQTCPPSKARAILEEAGSMTHSCHFPPVHMLRRIGFRSALLLVIGAGCASNKQAAPTTTSIPVPLASALIDARGS